MRLPDFELERFFVPHEFACKHVICSSDSQNLTVTELLSMADDDSLALWNDLLLAYTNTKGHPLLREQIAKLYDTVTPDQILVFSGAEEAIFATPNVLLGPGDHAIVVWPTYQSLHDIARSCEAEVEIVEIRHEDGWRLDPARVIQALRPNTKLVVLNFPNNPSGATIPAGDFRAIASAVHAHGATLFSDEVYRWLEHDEKDRLPAAADLNDSAMSLGVMSKSFGLPGLRIGWIATKDDALRDRLEKFKDYTTICNPAPSEILALIAIRNREQILETNRSIARSNLALLAEFIGGRPDLFEWVEPHVGCIAFPKLLGRNVREFSEALVREQSTLLMPGNVFGHTGNHFRIGFGKRSFSHGLEALGDFVNSEQ